MKNQRGSGGGWWVVLAAALVWVVAGAGAVAAADSDRPTVMLVIGAAGEEEYGTNFARQTELWLRLCTQALARPILIGQTEAGEPTDRDRLAAALGAEAAEDGGALWLVMIGHGTFDGKEARFNLRGPDVSASELATWLKPFRRPLVVINTASASAPFLASLAGTNRIVITATRSGNEQSFSRFGGYFAAALAEPASDLDQDGQVSVLEAFLSAAAHVAEFYTTEGRLAAEHALLDDNGDGLGTPGDWFRGVRAVKKPRAGAVMDGARAHQTHLVLSPKERALPPALRAQRDALELAVIHLRETKAGRTEDDYYRELEELLLKLVALTGWEDDAPASDRGRTPDS